MSQEQEQEQEQEQQQQQQQQQQQLFHLKTAMLAVKTLDNVTWLMFCKNCQMYGILQDSLKRALFTCGQVWRRILTVAASRHL